MFDLTWTKGRTGLHVFIVLTVVEDFCKGKAWDQVMQRIIHSRDRSYDPELHATEGEAEQN